MTVAPSPLNERRRAHPPHILWLVATALVAAAIAVTVTLLLQHDLSQGSSSSSGLHGSGVVATQTRHLASFRSIDLAGANVVTVRVGDRQTVTVRGDDNLIRLITTRVTSGKLVVDQSRSFTTRSGMAVQVTVPALDAVTLSGSGVLTVDGVRGSEFSVRVPGSGLVTANGTVSRLDARLSGSADVRLQDLTARDVAASVSGSGRLQVHASRSLDASLSGSGAIFYGGSPPKVTQNVTGSGAILKSS
jgi:hypothetical protein